MTVDVIGLVQKMVGRVQKHRLIEQAPLSLFPAFALFSLPPSPPHFLHLTRRNPLSDLTLV